MNTYNNPINRRFLINNSLTNPMNVLTISSTPLDSRDDNNISTQKSGNNNIISQCKEFRKVTPDVLLSNGFLLQDSIEIKYRVYDLNECNVYESLENIKPEELIHLDCCEHQILPSQFKKAINSGCKVCPCCGRDSTNYFLFRPFINNSMMSLMQNYSSKYSRVVLVTEFFDPNILYSIIKGSQYSELCKKDFFFITSPEQFENIDEIISNYSSDKTIIFLNTKNDTKIECNDRHRIKVVI